MASPAAGLIQANRHEQHNICGEKLSLSECKAHWTKDAETQVWTGLDLQDRCPEWAELPQGREQAAHPQVCTQSHSPSPLHRVGIHLYLSVLTKHILIHRSSPCSQNRSGTKPKYSCSPRHCLVCGLGRLTDREPEDCIPGSECILQRSRQGRHDPGCSIHACRMGLLLSLKELLTGSPPWAWHYALHWTHADEGPASVSTQDRGRELRED